MFREGGASEVISGILEGLIDLWLSHVVLRKLKLYLWYLSFSKRFVELFVVDDSRLSKY